MDLNTYSIKRAFLDTPEGQVHYYTGGAGEPLLLLHQTPQASDSNFGELTPMLIKKRYFAIAMDNPGYGEWIGSIRPKTATGAFKEVKGPWSGAASVESGLIKLAGNATAVFISEN